MKSFDDQQFQTKLLYETMASPLVEKTLGLTRLHIGEWKAKGRPHQDADGRWVHIVYNEGMPVTFEFHEAADGALIKTRERPTFLWEAGFNEGEWFNDVSRGPEWMDGMMFPAVLPSDFVFGVVSEWTVPKGAPKPTVATIARGTPIIPVNRNDVYTLVHFQPVGHFGEKSYDKPLEIETAVTNVGPIIHMTHIAGASLNYLNVHNSLTKTIESLTNIGFVHDKFWKCPKGHQLLGPGMKLSPGA